LFEGPLLRLRYIANTKISNGDKLIINFKYNRKKDSKEILYKEEPVIIPFVNEALFCNYKYILPDDYIGLGSELNFLKQESDTIYTFYGIALQISFLIQHLMLLMFFILFQIQ
jgi:hypothetical protein